MKYLYLGIIFSGVTLLVFACLLLLQNIVS